MCVCVCVCVCVHMCVHEHVCVHVCACVQNLILNRSCEGLSAILYANIARYITYIDYTVLRVFFFSRMPLTNC